jgi:cysteine-rich repeat protein
MNELSLKTLILGLISSLAIACGDPGDSYVEGDPTFGEQNDVEQGGDFIEEDDLVDEEPPVDEEPEPFCGDGLIDNGEQCDDGNVEAGDGCSVDCEVEELVSETDGTVRITLTLDDLSSNTQPLEANCVDTVRIVKEESTLRISGECAFPANFVEIAGVGEVDEGGSVSGQLTFTLNGRENQVPFDGRIDVDTLEVAFFGATLVGGPVRGVWDGTIDAVFD